MKVLFASSEIGPWVKTGGLGDVAAALPPALQRAGCEVRVLVPEYPALRAAFPRRAGRVALASPGGRLPAAQLSRVRLASGVELLLLDAPELYERPGNPYLGPDGHDWPDNAIRFGLLARVAALLASGEVAPQWRPDVLHCNDWQTALAPAFLRYLAGGPAAATVVSIHNLAFHGLFDPEVLETLGLPAHAFTIDGVEFHGRLSFLKAGLQACDRIATVSPSYAREILQPEFGSGLDGLLRYRAGVLRGILNGIDTDAWDPANDPAIAAGYDAATLARKARNKRDLQRILGLEARADAPLVGVVSRLTEQKGLDLLLEIGEPLCDAGAQIALLGSGDALLQAGWRALAQRRPAACAVEIGFDEALAHRIEAGADVFAMPSRFEPCGLNQMYSLRYGTPPVVRRTGGLADTVVDPRDATRLGRAANGFVFDAPSTEALLEALERAFAALRDTRGWRRLQRAGMACDLGWGRAADEYCDLYRAAIGGQGSERRAEQRLTS